MAKRTLSDLVSSKFPTSIPQSPKAVIVAAAVDGVDGQHRAAGPFGVGDELDDSGSYRSHWIRPPIGSCEGRSKSRL